MNVCVFFDSLPSGVLTAKQVFPKSDKESDIHCKPEVSQKSKTDPLHLLSKHVTHECPQIKQGLRQQGDTIRDGLDQEQRYSAKG